MQNNYEQFCGICSMFTSSFNNFRILKWVVFLNHQSVFFHFQLWHSWSTGRGNPPAWRTTGTAWASRKRRNVRGRTSLPRPPTWRRTRSRGSRSPPSLSPSGTRESPPAPASSFWWWVLSCDFLPNAVLIEWHLTKCSIDQMSRGFVSNLFWLNMLLLKFILTFVRKAIGLASCQSNDLRSNVGLIQKHLPNLQMSRIQPSV